MYDILYVLQAGESVIVDTISWLSEGRCALDAMISPVLVY
jgi:hypothetical protein